MNEYFASEMGELFRKKITYEHFNANVPPVFDTR